MATRRWSSASTKLACVVPASPRSELADLKAAYRVIYRSGLMWQEMLDTLQLEFPVGPAAEFLPSSSSGGKRGFVQERRTPPGAIVRLRRDETDDNAFESAGARKESRLNDLSR